jgi:type IV pilus assembly protein PilE
MRTEKVHGRGWGRSIGGFTLIELMAVVVVIAILAVIALPAYTEHVRKSRRAEAITLLNRVAQEQERWRANCTTYASNTASAPAAGCTGGLGVANPSSGYYVLSIASAASSSYFATAAASGAQTSDANCAVLQLRVAGSAVDNWYWAGTSLATLANSATNQNARKCWNR